MTPTTAHVYDDANSSIPAGLTGELERVVVIGAGIAGLTVASALAEAGVECVILEARSRIGGRLHTIDLEGTPVDLGGSWIHHPEGNPLRRFAAEQAVECLPGNPLAKIAAYDAVEARLFNRAELTQSLATQSELFPDALESLRAELPIEANAAEAVEAFADRQAMTPLESRRMRQALRAVIEADAACQAEQQSLRWLWNEIEYGGDLFGDLPVGGYQSVLAAMAAGLDVRLDVEVDRVVATSDDVRIHTIEGHVEVGSHVVVTVPLGVLKASAIDFEPPLPASKIAAIRQLGFGRYEKVALVFERAFWRDAGFSHLMHFPREPDQPTTWLFDLDAFGAGPAIVAHAFHSASQHVLAGEAAAAGWARRMLAEAVLDPCPEPVAVAATSWADDPFSRGAYSHVPPGAIPEQLDHLGEPVHGRVLFAGEHTQSARTGYADGAMTSGVREAKRLLRQPNVRLTGMATASQSR